jgi:hypothetical protein
MVRLGNRIITVGNDLNYLYENNDSKLANMEKMNIINEKILELI